jgi:hypothetical protein
MPRIFFKILIRLILNCDSIFFKYCHIFHQIVIDYHLFFFPNLETFHFQTITFIHTLALLIPNFKDGYFPYALTSGQCSNNIRINYDYFIHFFIKI